MKANGQDFDALGDVLVRYDSGFGTMLQNQPHLACRVALLGKPTRVTRLGSARFSVEWDLPGRVERFLMGNPYPMDKRQVLSLEVTDCAHKTTAAWLRDLLREAQLVESRARGVVWDLRAAAQAVEARLYECRPERECGDCAECAE